MSATAQGGSSKLPRGPHGLPADDVAADQRQRLIDAMVDLVGEQGYASMTVAHIIERAEVSRKTFYEHFADRKQLLLAAFDAASPLLLEEARAALERTGGSTRQLETMMRRLCQLTGSRPGTSALATIDIAAAGPAGVERHDKLIEDYGEIIGLCLSAHGPGEAHLPLPATLARALAGGVSRTIDAHLRLGHTRQLPELGTQLARWGRSYHPVPRNLSGGEAVPVSLPWFGLRDGLLGGRAPGTLTLAPEGYEPHNGRRSPASVAHASRERIMDAVAVLIAESGYTELTATAIAERADLPERAFLAQFKSKDEAFAAAVEVGHIKGQAIVQRARASEQDWRGGVRAAVSALVEFLASEPYFTRLAFVDAPLAGPGMAQRTHEHLGAYARLLFDGAPQRRHPPQVAPEAIVQTIVELGFHEAAQNAVGNLLNYTRDIVYLALAPFVGVTEAAEAAVSA